MRANNPNSVSYNPGEVPADPNEFQRYLRDEFTKISSAILALSLGHLDITAVAPAKPRDGDVRYANGSSWDPGSGVGIYYYKGAASAWVFLG